MQPTDTEPTLVQQPAAAPKKLDLLLGNGVGPAKRCREQPIANLPWVISVLSVQRILNGVLDIEVTIVVVTSGLVTR